MLDSQQGQGILGLDISSDAGLTLVVLVLPLILCAASSLAFVCLCRARRQNRAKRRYRAKRAEGKKPAEKADVTHGHKVYSWADIAQIVLPGGSHIEGSGPTERYSPCGLLDNARTLDREPAAHRFASSPPLAVLATGEARAVMHKAQKRSFMLHSVKLAVTTHEADCVLQEEYIGSVYFSRKTWMPVYILVVVVSIYRSISLSLYLSRASSMCRRWLSCARSST